MTRGDVFFVDFGIPFGSEPGYRRPVIVIQSDRENLDALNTKVVIPLTSTICSSFLNEIESGLDYVLKD